MYYMYTVVGIQNEYWVVIDDINEYIDKLFVCMFKSRLHVRRVGRNMRV